MPAVTTVIKETKFWDCQPMDEVRRFMREGQSGEIVIRVSQGKICWILTRIKSIAVEQGDTTSTKRLTSS